MKTARAKTAWLAEPGARLDATYHLSEGRQAKIHIELCPEGTIKVRDVSKSIFYGGRSRRHYVQSEEYGVPFMGSSDMLKADFGSLKYLSKKLTPDLKSYFPEKGWTLISRSGTIGNTAYVTEDFLGKAASEHIIRVVPNGTIPSGYLYAFLSSKFGYGLLTQGTFGAVIQHIEPHHIADLPVPLLPDVEQQQIHAQIEEASRLRVEANRLLAEADATLIRLLDLSPEQYKQLTSPNEADTSMSFHIKAGQVNPLSLRARNFGKRLTKIVEVLSRGKHEALIDVLQIPPYYTGRFKRIASSSPSAMELFSQSDIFALKPQGQMISPRTVPFRDKVVVEKGSILVAGVGTLGENEIFGRARFVWGYLEDRLVAQHIIRFEPNDKVIEAGYLFAVLNSKLWFRIFRSSVCGTNLLGFIIPMLNQMPVPRFEKAVEKEIGANVKQAYENRTRANDLENAAIAHIERAIESWQD